MTNRLLLGGLAVALFVSSGCGDDGVATGGAGAAGSGGSSGDDGGAGGTVTDGGRGGDGGAGGARCSAPADCDDNDLCTTDACDGTSCQHAAIDCDDQVFCNGVETCDPERGCQAGAAIDPDDGVDCTVDACDEDADAIVNTPTDSECPDVHQCTDDVCDPVDGCVEIANNEENCATPFGCYVRDGCDPVEDCKYSPMPAMCADAFACTTDTCELDGTCGNRLEASSCGGLVITEIMKNPSVPFDDGVGEWFEVTNVGSAPIDLGGCTIKDDGTNAHVIAGSLPVPAGGRVTLAKSASPGFTPSYVFGAGFDLANGEDEIVIECAGQEVARVSWDDGVLFPDPTGASMSLRAGALDGVAALYGRNWCASTTSYATGNLGTPGAPNDACPLVFPFALTYEQLVPPVFGSGPVGSCTLTVNAAETQMDVSCTHVFADTLPGAHILQAPIGSNGPVVFTFPSAVSPMTASFALTPSEAQTLKTGGFYVQLRSNLNDVARGQIVQPTLLSHMLTGAEAVPPVSTAARGVCVHAIPLGPWFIESWCSQSAPATGASLGQGPWGVGGTPYFAFASPGPILFERFVLDQYGQMVLQNGQFYIQVDTATHPTGELRGQMRP